MVRWSLRVRPGSFLHIAEGSISTVCKLYKQSYRKEALIISCLISLLTDRSIFNTRYNYLYIAMTVRVRGDAIQMGTGVTAF